MTPNRFTHHILTIQAWFVLAIALVFIFTSQLPFTTALALAMIFVLVTLLQLSTAKKLKTINPPKWARELARISFLLPPVPFGWIGLLGLTRLRYITTLFVPEWLTLGVLALRGSKYTSKKKWAIIAGLITSGIGQLLMIIGWDQLSPSKNR